MLKNWQEYAVTGCKIKWVPANVVGLTTSTDTSSFVQNIWTWQSADGGEIDDMEEAQISALSNFKIHNPKNAFKLYFDCRKYSAS